MWPCSGAAVRSCCTSRFGAELDSLADFFNFGVAPGLILYFWGLNALGNLGWIAAMVSAI